MKANGRYILDGHTPVEEPDLLTWARWLETANRRVAYDELGDVRVSTVFLGLDQRLGSEDGPPLLFETMIFGGPHDGYQDRYATCDVGRGGSGPRERADPRPHDGARMKLDLDLPTLSDQAGGPQPKGPSRLEDETAARYLTYVTDRDFRKEIWRRDLCACRWCGRRVRKTLEHVPDRGEVHHLHGRLGVLRFEAKAAALFCLACHELLTGKVNERWIVVGTVFWSLPNSAELLIDARELIHFDRVA